ncbi:hypothetical protein [Herbiconiux sp. YIM B11900]|uniref:hypothetical protein n=1 Tax=Herbiconiux sp. YIM B11900 TaxID=3404131 RepID=UPI003F83AA44
MTPKASENSPLSREEAARRNYLRRRRFKIIGLTIVGAGALVVVVHWLTHIEAFGPTQPPLFLDLVAGYPMGVVLLLAGGLVAGRK